MHYIRYMDDVLILCKTRHRLRKAVRILNLWLERFGFQQHPDKTFIGRVAKGFGSIGLDFNTQWKGSQAQARELSLISPKNFASFMSKHEKGPL